MKKPTYYKDFSNVSEVFDKMLELGFFFNEDHRDQAQAELEEPYPGPFSTSEYWYSNSAIEVKIFRGLYGSYELRNYRGICHPELEELFAVAHLSKIG